MVQDACLRNANGGLIQNGGIYNFRNDWCGGGGAVGTTGSVEYFFKTRDHAHVSNAGISGTIGTYFCK